MRKLTIAISLILLGCTSTEMVENYKNPDIVIFHASKVLLVGMAQNEGIRVDFETNLKKEFDARNVEAMRSIDLFDVDFTSAERTDRELDAVEQSLLDKDFDAILITKIVGSESRQSFRKTLAELNKFGDGFKEDYQRNQGIYYDEDYYDQHTVYNAETSLYCICVGKERSLIWRGSIEITNPNNVDKTIEDYVELVVAAMEEQDLIFYEDWDKS